MAVADDPILQALERSGLTYEIMACDPAFSDTAEFCAHYGHSLAISANTILVKSKTGEQQTFVRSRSSGTPA